MMAPETKSSKATFMRLLLAATLAGAATMSAPALAADLPTSPSAAANPQTTLPSLAADPQTQAPNWSGFYVGAGVEGSFAKGAKSAFGGDVYAGYDHVFDNNVVLGARFSTGFSPWAVPGSRFQGMDFAETSVKMGYEMGRLTPYVMTGVALARPAFSGGGIANMSDSPTACSAALANSRRLARPASVSTMRSPTIFTLGWKRQSPTARAAPRFSREFC